MRAGISNMTREQKNRNIAEENMRAPIAGKFSTMWLRDKSNLRFLIIVILILVLYAFVSLNTFPIIFNLRETLDNAIEEHIDVDFVLWLSWLLMPLLITFFLPFVIIILLYVNALILYIYKLHRNRLRSVYGSDWRNAARNIVAAVWDAHGWICHGYEVVGLENIPKDEPVLMVYYHGAIPIDLYYFLSKVFLQESKLFYLVADKFLFNIPGWAIIADVVRIMPGTIQTCTNVLKEGHSLAISPGGVYEAQFGDSYYQLMWKKRLGFAKVALNAKVSIVPIFTRNIREAFRTITWGRRLWLRIYAMTRFPFMPIYGGFPVKLTTYVGKPIPYDANCTPEELHLKVAESLSNLIKQHQRIPGSIFLGMLERLGARIKEENSN